MAESYIRSERRLGEMLIEKATVGRPTLADAGIDKKLSARSQKLAAVPDTSWLFPRPTRPSAADTVGKRARDTLLEAS